MQILSYVCWFEWRKLGKFIHETEFAIVSFVRSYFSSYDRKFNLSSFFVVVVDVTSGNSSLTYAHCSAACSIVILRKEQGRKKTLNWTNKWSELRSSTTYSRLYEYWIEWIWQNMENWVLFIKCSSSCWTFSTWYTSILKQICDWQ